MTFKVIYLLQAFSSWIFLYTYAPVDETSNDSYFSASHAVLPSVIAKRLVSQSVSAVESGGKVFTDVCMFVFDISKADAARITELYIEMFHDRSWKLFICEVAKTTGVGFCNLVSAGV